MRRAAACLVLVVLAACGRPAVQDGDGGSGGTGMRFLAEGGQSGFEQALAPRPFRFPADHGSHPRYRTEWWYYTGNLFADGGRHFGFELTFFRLGLSPDPPASGSEWATNQAWMAHFAVTDTARDEFSAEERFARGALGLAGASGMPFRVWLENWSVSGAGDDGHGTMRLVVAGDTAGLDLELRAVKPPVMHGDAGLDAKGPERGNASYYYSLSRLEANGTLTSSGERIAVTGLAWMDREWGTSALSAGVVGWDWFALQLDDGRDLMWYRLRAADGTASPFSGGSLIERDGARRALGAAEIRLEALANWRSPRTGIVYPVRWRLTVPDVALSLSIEPYVDDQEVALSVRYWEGAVRVTGTSHGEPITGNGYLELAGY